MWKRQVAALGHQMKKVVVSCFLYFQLDPCLYVIDDVFDHPFLHPLNLIRRSRAALICPIVSLISSAYSRQKGARLTWFSVILVLLIFHLCIILIIVSKFWYRCLRQPKSRVRVWATYSAFAHLVLPSVSSKALLLILVSYRDIPVYSDLSYY